MSQHHDPVHPDGEHLSPEALADLDLGLLDDDSAAHARHHLDHCHACQQLHADLAALTDTLSALGTTAPEPMPDEVWDELVGVLATEPVTTPQGSATVVPLQAQTTRRRRPGIGLVAGAAGVALVGAIGVSFVVSNGDSVSTLSGSSSNADSAGQPESSLAPEAFAATRSGTQYKEDQLDEQVIELVAARAPINTEDNGSSPTASGSADPWKGSGTGQSMGEAIPKLLRTAGPMVTDPAAAQECLEDYLDVQGIAPLAVDIGIWQGKPAAVIVLPLDDPALVQVWVINPVCDTSGQDPLYYFATVRAG